VVAQTYEIIPCNRCRLARK